MAVVKQELGVVEYEILTRVKSGGRLLMTAIGDPDVARALIKDGLLVIQPLAVKGIMGITVILSPLGEAALTGADPALRLEAANVDAPALSERIRQHAERVKLLTEMQQQKADVLAAVERANKDIWEGIKRLKDLTDTEESDLEEQIKKAHGAGIEFSYALNGIQVADGTEGVIADPYAMITWLMERNEHNLPDMDSKTKTQKRDGNGKLKTISLVALKNTARIIARYRKLAETGEHPCLKIVPTTKVRWSKELPQLWEQGIKLALVPPPEDDVEKG